MVKLNFDISVERPTEQSALTPAPFKVVCIGTGIGKTQEAILQALVAVRRARQVALLVPTHSLGAELTTRIEVQAAQRSLQVSVATWRGRETDNPARLGEKMCTEPSLLDAARHAHVDMRKTVCPLCPKNLSCSYLAQSEITADIWLAPHEVLYQEPPTPMAASSLLVIDEGFALKGLVGIDGAPIIVSVDELTRTPILKSADKTADLHDELMPIRQQLLDALTDHPPGGLRKRPLLDAGLTARKAARAQKLEWSAKVHVRMRNATLLGLIEQLKAAKVNTQNARREMLWRGIECLLDDPKAEISGRAQIEDGKLQIFDALPIHEAWQAMPTVHLDATRNSELVKTRVPHAEFRPEIKAATQHQSIVQYYDRAFGKKSLIEGRLLERVYDWSVSYASRAGGDWLIVLPKAAEEVIVATRQPPPFIRLAHFNGLRGLDQYRDVRGIIVVGRTQAPPNAVERLAGVLTGRLVSPIDGWYPSELIHLRSNDGTVVTLEVDRHPDPLAEAVRQHICEAELIQAIGRGRGVSRTAENPLQIVMLGNVVVPGTIPDELHPWDGSTIDDEMLSRFGVVLSSSGDMALVADMTSKKIKSARERSAPFLYKEYLYGNGAHLRTAIYQLAGSGRSKQMVTWDPVRISEMESWLVERLGPLAMFDGGELDPVIGIQAVKVDANLIVEASTMARVTEQVAAVGCRADRHAARHAADPAGDHFGEADRIRSAGFFLG